MASAPGPSTRWPARPARPAWLRPLPDFLFRDEGSKPSYVAKAWLLALIPSLLLSALVSAAAPDAVQPDLPAPGLELVFLAVFFAPAVETALMISPLLILGRLLGPAPAVALSAAGWGILHSLAAPVWGLVIWWPFLVMSIALLTWRGRGLWTAATVVFAIHAMQNATATVLMFLAEL